MSYLAGVRWWCGLRLGGVTDTADARTPTDTYRGPLARLPLPSPRIQRLAARVNLICQIGIATTGVTVRVTGSGLGCDDWPRCNEGSFVPVPGASPMVHQLIEFGNRLLTFVLVAAAVAVVLAVYRAGRRRELKLLAWTMPLGIVAQAVIGGISVLTDLKWWTVALHLIPTMLLAWLAAVLYVRIGEPDGVEPRQVHPDPLRWLIMGSAAVLTIVLVTGTMVTGAGPHAGDAKVGAGDRLQLPIQWLVHFHAEAMVGYLALLIGVLAGVAATGSRGPARRRAGALIALVVCQAAVGILQYRLGVPEALVVLHVTLAAIITAVTGALWAAGRIREDSVTA